MSQSASYVRDQTSTAQGYRYCLHDMTNVSIPEVNMFKNSATLALSIPTNLSIKLSFVSVNEPTESYFVDAPRNLIAFMCGIIGTVPMK